MSKDFEQISLKPGLRLICSKSLLIDIQNINVKISMNITIKTKKYITAFCKGIFVIQLKFIFFFF